MALSLRDHLYPSMEPFRCISGPGLPGYHSCIPPFPHRQPLDVLHSPGDLLHPLKSLGRLVGAPHAALPFTLTGFSLLHHSPSVPGGISDLLPPPSLPLFGPAPGPAGPASAGHRDKSPRPVPPDARHQGRRVPRGARRWLETGPAPPRPQAGQFTEEDLNRVLYGHTNVCGASQPVHQAISGLRITEITGEELQLQLLDRRDSLDIPEGLSVSRTTCGGFSHFGVFCCQNPIPIGVRFGPFTGKVVNMSEIKTYDDNSFMWEIFQDGRLSHFIDGKGVAGNWMAFVNCARSPGEQNLTALQSEGKIFYETCRVVCDQQELLVWYGEGYLQFMGIPVTLKEMTESPLTDQTEECDEGYKCERCGKVFAYKYYRDKHLKYTRCVDQGDRKFPCHLCNRSFEKRDRLRIHILHVHEKHRPHKCSVCGKSFSQSSSLNKHMRVHSGERPYKCVYCNKAFTASSILRTHIRQHSGEKPFKCRHCGKAFASHAAHDSHVRRTHAKEKSLTCTLCSKTFPEEHELKVHQEQLHAGERFQVDTAMKPELYHMPPIGQIDSMNQNYLYNSSEEPLLAPNNLYKEESSIYGASTGITMQHNDGRRPWN